MEITIRKGNLSDLEAFRAFTHEIRDTMAETEKTLHDRIQLCTIHPDNRCSLENTLRLGYRIEKRIARYDSVRYVLRKDTKSPVHM